MGGGEVAAGVAGFDGEGDVVGFATAAVEAPLAGVEDAVVIQIDGGPAAAVFEGRG